MFKKYFYLLLACSAGMCVTASAQPQSHDFVPYATTDLRLPSVPLFTNNPYFSLWSPFDHLNDGTTRHWSDAEKAMDGLLRVDGSTYRFMGEDRKIILKAIAPMASAEKGWEARVSHSPQSDERWAAATFDDRKWTVEEAAWGTIGEYPHCRNRWDQENSDIYLRRRVTLSADDLKKDLYLQFSHDDAFEIFLNGRLIINTGETWVQGEQHRLTAEEKVLLKRGETSSLPTATTIGEGLMPISDSSRMYGRPTSTSKTPHRKASTCWPHPPTTPSVADRWTSTSYSPHPC